MKGDRRRKNKRKQESAKKGTHIRPPSLQLNELDGEMDPIHL